MFDRFEELVVKEAQALRHAVVESVRRFNSAADGLAGLPIAIKSKRRIRMDVDTTARLVKVPLCVVLFALPPRGDYFYRYST